QIQKYEKATVVHFPTMRPPSGLNNVDSARFYLEDMASTLNKMKDVEGLVIFDRSYISTAVYQGSPMIENDWITSFIVKQGSKMFELFDPDYKIVRLRTSAMVAS